MKVTCNFSRSEERPSPFLLSLLLHLGKPCQRQIACVEIESRIGLRPHSPSGENWICWWMMWLCHNQRSRRTWVVVPHGAELSKFERESAFARTRKGTTFPLPLMLWRTSKEAEKRCGKRWGICRRNIDLPSASGPDRIAWFPRFFIVDS